MRLVIKWNLFGESDGIETKSAVCMAWLTQSSGCNLDTSVIIFLEDGVGF